MPPSAAWNRPLWLRVAPVNAPFSCPKSSDSSRFSAIAEQLIAEIVGIQIPFNNCITGFSAFAHKAGIHTKAVLKDPNTYEVLDPALFGMERHIMVGHPLTGKHAVCHRARLLGFDLDEAALLGLTRQVKFMADQGPIQNNDLDRLIRSWPGVAGTEEVMHVSNVS